VLFDLSADYTLFSRYRVFASLRNLTDETYIASRRPYGLRPGLPRTLLVGFSATF
jgi:Fe(3+) dicitrate transport protein